MPSQWPTIGRTFISVVSIWRYHWRRSPERTKELLRRVMSTRLRNFLGLGGT
jgi:hypothetical protein